MTAASDGAAVPRDHGLHLILIKFWALFLCVLWLSILFILGAVIVVTWL